MVAACLISTILTQEPTWDPSYLEEQDLTPSNTLEGPSPEEVYAQGKLLNHVLKSSESIEHRRVQSDLTVGGRAILWQDLQENHGHGH
jgi:hypothetical protein